MEEKGPYNRGTASPLLLQVALSAQKFSSFVFHPFCKGGIEADTGLTGRKLISEGYGSEIPNGGGALAGKDGGKVDRLGAYLARLIAKSIVKEEGREWAFVTLSFLFGEKNVHSIEILTEKGVRKTGVKEF